MELNRRKILGLGASAVALVSLSGLPAFASLTDDAIVAMTDGAEVTEGGIELISPEIAENGNTVPIAVSSPGAVEIALFAAGNPTPAVATFKFGPLAGARSGSTRIRLAKTQDVIAVAKMEDGTFRRTSAIVKVTIGGCGG